MSQASPLEIAEEMPEDVIRDLANSEKDTAWIYQAYLDHYVEDEE